MFDVKTIDGLIRVVYRNTGKLASNLIFDTYADGWAYVDKVEENFVAGQIA